MKHALMTIMSAWSVTFIVLFFVFVLAESPVTLDSLVARNHIIFALFVGAVTGAGWLWFRHVAKRHDLYCAKPRKL